jgi:hypothetical protein
MADTKTGIQPAHFKQWNMRPKKQGPFIRNCPRCNKPHVYARYDGMMRAIRQNTICNSCSTIIYKKSWQYVIKDEHIKQMAAKQAGYNSFTEYMKDIEAKKLYYREVRKITRKQDISTLNNYDKLRGLNGTTDAYQVDHIISVSEGFRLNLPPSQIGDITNLQIIPWQDNLLKSNKPINH